MKQSEKSRLTYEKILNAAIVEFGTKSYDSASLNNICNDNNISKGLIYHNFKNKDELYLQCVKSCFEAITDFLCKDDYTADDFSQNIKNLLDLRYHFFSNNPYYSYIFFNAVLQPPESLAMQIKQLKSDFDEFNSKQFKRILKSVSLRDGITEDEAAEYFIVFQEMFNRYFKNKNCESTDFSSFVEDHEVKLSKFLNIMLYGIAHNNKNHKENAENDTFNS